MITEDYVSYEIAKLLEEKGFNGICRTAYETISNTHEVEECAISMWGKLGQVKRPTVQMAMKWLREVHNKFIEICTDKAYNFKDIVFRPSVYDKELDCLWESDNFSTYEKACEEAIKYCLENLI